ncbi:teichoic acid biosynthesis protein C [Thermomonospora umbrina]|uniref:P68 RBP/TagC-like beta-propeller domain-containing protein n=1 Tax=Thermomonospora umbrina TaxID=111806 RepID=A0A3D9SVY8_9ACTN|nr:teichoic acid biosynthesis protein C [Thermomonospora umbrina]REE95831.1 hypothetical protein DFJ69_1244 [Thermomonospora umbrina]
MQTTAGYPGGVRRAAPVAAAVLILGGFTAGASGVPGEARSRPAARLPDSQRFDLTEPSHELFRHRRLRDGTVMQSFGFDLRNRRLFAAQVARGPFSDHRGDLTINRLDHAGRLKGHMRLRGFGHGVAIGVEPSGSATYLWVEVDPHPASDSARGTRLARFKYVDGATLENDSPALAKHRPIPGITGVTATIDPVNNRLAMRYKKGNWRVAVYNLADVKARRYDRRLADVALPSQGGETFQGYALYGRYLYTFHGNEYGEENPPPGNARLSTIDLNTGRRVAGPTLTKAGRSLTHREPEGLAVYRTGRGEVRLFLGIASGRVGHRRANLFYKDAPAR